MNKCKYAKDKKVYQNFFIDLMLIYPWAETHLLVPPQSQAA